MRDGSSLAVGVAVFHGDDEPIGRQRVHRRDGSLFVSNILLVLQRQDLRRRVRTLGRRASRSERGASKMVSTIAAKNHAPVFRGGTSHALCRPSACISTIRSVRDARAISSATGFSSPWAARNLPGGGLAILVAR